MYDASAAVELHLLYKHIPVHAPVSIPMPIPNIPIHIPIPYTIYLIHDAMQVMDFWNVMDKTDCVMRVHVYGM